ncbi:MAG: hypothetical protein H7196_00315 [candidate division SR1 bacterium]|nr:hypothetical protein [candidate division SR1 bacterium]
MSKTLQVFKFLLQKTFYYSLIIILALSIQSILVFADVGTGISTFIDSLYTQLAPVINSVAVLAIGLGGILFVTAGGNIDKRSLGKKIFFGALGGILIYNIAPGVVKWASTNLNITF